MAMDREKLPTVLHVVNSLTGGGTERTLCALLQEFDHDQMRHVVVTLRAAGRLTRNLPDRVSCVPLGLLGRSPLAGLRLGRVVRTQRAAIIHARNTGCWADAVIARLCQPRVKLVLGFHGLEHDGPMSDRELSRARWARRFGARFTTVSHAGSRLLQHQAHIDFSRITVLETGIDLERFVPAVRWAPSAVRKELGITSSTFVVGAVGSLSPVKDQATLLQAFAQAFDHTQDTALILLGDGPMRSKLHEQAQALGIASHVSFLGNRDDVPDVLAALDVFVCSSESEGLSNSMLEAMACGIPIITTGVGDHARIIRSHLDGIVVPPGLPSRIAAELTFLFRDAATRHGLGEAARRRVTRFDIRSAATRYERFYTRITDNRQPNRNASTTYNVDRPIITGLSV